ncbi:hypothetical protein DFH09DRAFT_1087722 [Mycena vulgaris]|nr:hypothetical protein DFH09DRAFT_1087722 [Mycena vulgaris]
MSSRPRGRPPGRGRGRGAKKSTAGTKRAVPADSNTEFAPAKPPKKAKAPPAPIEPRILPARKRAAEPGKPDQPRVNRTPAEVQAAQAKKAQAAQDRISEREAAIAKLADIEARQAAAEAEEEENAIFELEDLPDDVVDEDEPILTISQEDFDQIEGEDQERVDDDNAYLSVSEFDKPKSRGVKATAVTKPKKPVKGETREAIEAALKELVARNKVKVKSMQNSDGAAASKKAGLTKDWKNKAVAAAGAAVRGAKTPESPKFGGFTDDDAAAARPTFESDTVVPRKNTMVSYVGSSDTDDDTPSKAPEVQAKTTTRRPIKPDPAARIPALSVIEKSTPKLKSDSSSASLPFTPGCAADVRGLPAFIARTWSTVFLPALYHVLYLSTNPMAIGSVGEDLLKPGKDTLVILRTALATAYPGNTWDLACVPISPYHDALADFVQAVSRVGERRSAFGRAGVQVVDRLFKSSKYYHALDSATPGAHKSKLAASDARYALRNNGPAFYKHPSPEDVCKLKQGQPGYVKPRGYLESRPIIDTITQFIKDEKFDVVITETRDGKKKVDLSLLPVGALGMAAAAVERAYRIRRNGIRLPKEKIPGFSSAISGPAVLGYIASIRELKSSRWESILESCGAEVTESFSAETEDPDTDTLDGVREHMYIPSSPGP